MQQQKNGENRTEVARIVLFHGPTLSLAFLILAGNCFTVQVRLGCQLPVSRVTNGSSPRHRDCQHSGRKQIHSPDRQSG